MIRNWKKNYSYPPLKNDFQFILKTLYSTLVLCITFSHFYSNLVFLQIYKLEKNHEKLANLKAHIQYTSSLASPHTNQPNKHLSHMATPKIRES